MSLAPVPGAASPRHVTACPIVTPEWRQAARARGQDPSKPGTPEGALS